MGLQGGPICTSQGDVNKVMPAVEVTERGGHVDREVVPLEAVLLCAAHGWTLKMISTPLLIL